MKRLRNCGMPLILQRILIVPSSVWSVIFRMCMFTRVYFKRAKKRILFSSPAYAVTPLKQIQINIYIFSKAFVRLKGFG